MDALDVFKDFENGLFEFESPIASVHDETSKFNCTTQYVIVRRSQCNRSKIVSPTIRSIRKIQFILRSFSKSWRSSNDWRYQLGISNIPVPCWYIHVLFKILYFKLVENWKTQMVFLEGSDLDFEMTQVWKNFISKIIWKISNRSSLAEFTPNHYRFTRIRVGCWTNS